MLGESLANDGSSTLICCESKARFFLSGNQQSAADSLGLREDAFIEKALKSYFFTFISLVICNATLQLIFDKVN